MYLASWFGIIFLVAFIIPVIFFLITLQNTLKIISPENRKMPPGNVWLILIPFVGIIWQFIVVRRISDSIREECIRLNVDSSEKMPTYTVGLIYCIFSLVYLIPSFVYWISTIRTIGTFVGLVTWIIYWVKVNQYKNLLIINKDNYMLDAEQEIFHTQL
jgi:hypothetical protein